MVSPVPCSVSLKLDPIPQPTTHNPHRTNHSSSKPPSPIGDGNPFRPFNGPYSSRPIPYLDPKPPPAFRPPSPMHHVGRRPPRRSPLRCCHPHPNPNFTHTCGAILRVSLSTTGLCLPTSTPSASDHAVNGPDMLRTTAHTRWRDLDANPNPIPPVRAVTLEVCRPRDQCALCVSVHWKGGEMWQKQMQRATRHSKKNKKKKKT